jgi:putative membrane protein
MTENLLLHEAGGWYWLGPFWFLFWIVLIVVLWRFVPWRRYRGRSVDARTILAERFARGEIDAAEYRARREVLDQ